MCLQQLISAFPKQGGAVDPQHTGPWGGSCSCTNYLQAETSPDLWCGLVPGALQRAALWREALWAGMQLPVPCGMAWVLLSQTPSREQMLLGQGHPQLGPALWQGFAACLPAILILALMYVT